MKKNYEDLQKRIDALNKLLGQAKEASEALKADFETEDLEMDNEIKNRVDDKIKLCDRDINGDKAEKVGDLDDRLIGDKSKTMQARKKFIIGQINQMVNSFNDNNKLIKESNKVAKSDSELNDLIQKNLQIQKENKAIEDLISDAKLFAD